ncbi:DUF6879 family protein [Actinomadura macra]|uniref:DUF6879 family protein n=1 Tax=Actinomadura macra TaxID=46164 RepID=UPI000A8337BA|nr:DUF6879 family protein [Actinomadura macra]
MGDIDFIGSDPDSQDERCPAVFRAPDTGDFYQQGRVVTDPEILKSLGGHVALAADEAVIWQPARMADMLAEAATGSYEQGRAGHGVPAFDELLAGTRRSAVHLEMRDSYGDSEGFEDWKAGGFGRTDRSRWIGLVKDATARGVRMRRARIVSEPVSDYIRWEHIVTDVNIDAGEEVRWLPRRQTWDLMLPGADFWMFDQRLVRFHFDAGNGNPLEEYEFVSDPRRVAPVVAAFEMVWERAIPHEEYKLD